MTINIHGKNYVTVAERLQELHKEFKGKEVTINTEVLFTEPRVVIKATLNCPRGTFTGISAANSSKQIEKESPYEVAETSAVGRCLAFAGYESSESIASAEEMKKSLDKEPDEMLDEIIREATTKNCPNCGAPMKISKFGKPYCSKLCWKQKQ